MSHLAKEYPPHLVRAAKIIAAIIRRLEREAMTEQAVRKGGADHVNPVDEAVPVM